MIATTVETPAKRQQSGYTRAVRFTIRSTKDGVEVVALDRKGKSGHTLRYLLRSVLLPGETREFPPVVLGGKTRNRRVVVSVRYL